MNNKQIRKEDLSLDEYEKCKKSPCYFYNKYWKVFDHDGNEIEKPQLTEEQFSEMVEQNKWMRIAKARRCNYNYPILPKDCFDKLPTFFQQQQKTF